MKTYRVSIVDWSKKTRWMPGKIVSEKYIKGLQAVRDAIPAKLHYSPNAKAFVAYDGNMEYFAIEC